MNDVLIDVSRLLGRLMKGRLPTGVDRVTLAYVEHFGKSASALVRFGGRWIEFDQAASQQIFGALLNPAENFRNIVRWYVARAYVFSWGSRGLRVLLNTDHSGLHDASYSLVSRRRGLLPVFFLHDIIPLTHPEYCRPDEPGKHHRRLVTMSSVGRGLIVNSHATLTSLKAYAQTTGLTMPPSVVAPLAPAALPLPESRRPMEEPYFVVLGTIEPRKNHLLLLNLWRQMAGDMKGEVPRLVVIGQRGWECEQVVDMLERCTSLNSCVYEVSRCTDAELSTWLYHAQALLFPSFVEGFGIPLVEALSLGLPVIASDLAVFHEVAGDIPDYLDPLDGVGWGEAIRAYAGVAHPLRLAQLERMRSFKALSWAQHFAEVERLLEQVDGK